MKAKGWTARVVAAALACALVMSFALAGCKSDGDAGGSDNKDAANTEATENADTAAEEESDEEEEGHFTDNNPVFIAYEKLHALGENVSELTYDDVVSQYLDGDPGYIGDETDEKVTYCWDAKDDRSVCHLTIPFDKVDGELRPTKFMQCAAGKVS